MESSKRIKTVHCGGLSIPSTKGTRTKGRVWQDPTVQIGTLFIQHLRCRSDAAQVIYIAIPQ